MQRNDVECFAVQNTVMSTVNDSSANQVIQKSETLKHISTTKARSPVARDFCFRRSSLCLSALLKALAFSGSSFLPTSIISITFRSTVSTFFVDEPADVLHSISSFLHVVLNLYVPCNTHNSRQTYLMKQCTASPFPSFLTLLAFRLLWLFFLKSSSLPLSFLFTSPQRPCST